MNLIEIILEICRKARYFMHFVFTRDFSALEKEIFGVSMVDIIALVIAGFALKEFILFFFTLTTKFFSHIAKNIMSHFSISILLTVRMILLRAKATVIYLIEREQIQAFIRKFSHQLPNFRLNI